MGGAAAISAPAAGLVTSVKSRAGVAGFYDRVYEVVCRVPAGRVTTYGDISRVLTGTSRSARSVGWALHGLPPERVHEVPWWRVINAHGRVSTSCQEHPASEQHARLIDEGVEFGANDRVDLDRYGWDGDESPI